MSSLTRYQNRSVAFSKSLRFIVSGIRALARKLTFETDCADVYSSFASNTVDFVLLDVRGRQAYKQRPCLRCDQYPVADDH